MRIKKIVIRKFVCYVYNYNSNKINLILKDTKMSTKVPIGPTVSVKHVSLVSSPLNWIKVNADGLKLTTSDTILSRLQQLRLANNV